MCKSQQVDQDSCKEDASGLADVGPAQSGPTLSPLWAQAMAGGGNSFAASLVGPAGGATSLEPEAAKTGRRDNAPSTKAAALGRHRSNLAMMEAIINAGLAQEPSPDMGADSRVNLLRNSAEWIDEGQAQMFVMTPTHDSHLRPSVNADQGDSLAIIADRMLGSQRRWPEIYALNRRTIGRDPNTILPAMQLVLPKA